MANVRQNTTVSERAKPRQPRGQATVEYSIVSHAIIFFGGLGLLPLASNLLGAITTFYDSVYAVLQSAAV